jgi:hypothetical protein
MPDGDEAVFGLMALHILDGRDYPLYCWGAHYAGALISYLAAASFWIFGVSGLALKTATLPFAAGYLGVTYSLARQGLDEPSARLALLLAAVPAAIPLAYSVKALGGYPEILFLGGLVLLLVLRLPPEPSASAPPKAHLFLLGFSGGFGLYILPLVLPYLAVALLFMLRYRRHVLRRRGWAWLLAGTALGLTPMFVYNMLFPMATLLRLGSRVLHLSRGELLDPDAGAGTAAWWLTRYLARLLGQFPAVLRNLGPLTGTSSGWGLLPSWVLVAAATLALVSTRGAEDPAARVAMGWLCAWMLPVIFLFVWLADLDRPRHLVPLYSVLPIGIAALYRRLRLTRPRIAPAVIVIPLAIATWDLASGAFSPSGVPTAPLIRALDRLDIRGFYSDYHVAYQTMFASRERILASPAAWGQTSSSDRMPEITRQVDALSNPGYVFLLHRSEADWFAQGLTRCGISFRRQQTEEFDIFARLSVPVPSAGLPVSSLDWTPATGGACTGMRAGEINHP